MKNILHEHAKKTFPTLNQFIRGYSINMLLLSIFIRNIFHQMFQ